MFAIQKIAMQYWSGPEKPGEVIYTVERYNDEETARANARMFNRELAGSMWEFRYIVAEI